MTPEHLKRIVRDNIRAKRADDGLSQAALATAIGVSPAAIAQIERGHTSASVEMLAKIATALGIQPSVLLIEDAFAPEKVA